MQLQTLLTASLLLLLFWKKDGISSAAEPGYLDFDNLPETNFSCESKVIGGYYADVETGCQMFHVCTIGQKGEITDIKFLCLNGTVFDQETRVCERLDEVDCSKTESFFDLNLQLYGNKAGPFGIEPENEEIVEEECDPEDEEECQRTDDGGVREEDEEGTGGGGPGKEKVPSINNNNGGAIQQTTFPPISVATTTTNRPNVFSSTSTARVPTSTLQPSTTGQPAFQSGDPDTIAALLALHNAFAQSLQHHDINNKQQQEQQQAQQQEQIEQQQRDIEEHQRKQHLQQIQQQKQQEQLQHQQAQLQQHQAQLDQRQQKITQQAAKQAANAYVAAVESQAPHAATAKPVPPPPQVAQQNLRLQQVAQQNLRSQQAAQQQVLQGVLQQQNLRPQQQVLQQQSLRPQQVPQQQQNLRLQQAAQQNLRSQQAAQQQVLQGVLQQGLQEVRQQQPTHRFPGQIHYDTSKQQNPVLPSQQEQQQKLLQQQQHRFPQQQVHYETSTSPQQDSPQRFPHFNSKPESNPRFPAQIHFEATKSPVIGAERFGGGAYVAEATKSPVIGAERFGGGAYGSEATKSPVIGAERFGGGAYQQNFGQQRGQSGERPQPFSFHQYDSQPSTTASPYLLHQLKVNRVKQEQQHSNFPRQASQRSITTPAVAVVTSTSTTTSIRSGATKKGQLHTGNDNLGPLHISNEGPLHTRSETFLGSSVTSSSSELLPGNNETAHAQSAEYEDYQEGDVGADPFFQDVPKIGRNKRDVEGVVRDSRIQEGATFGGEVARVKGSVRDSEKENGATFSGGVAGVNGDVRNSANQSGATFGRGVRGSVKDSETQNGVTFSVGVTGVKGSVRNSANRSGATFGRGVAGVRGSVRNSEEQNGATLNRGVAGVKDSKNQTRESSMTGYDNKKKEESETLNKNNRKNLKTKNYSGKNTKISETSGKVGMKDNKSLKKKYSIHDRIILADSKSYNNQDINVKNVDDSKFIVRNSEETQPSDSVLNSNHEQKIVSIVSDSSGSENIYTTRKIVKREARYVQRDDDDRYESEEEEEDDDNRVGKRKNTSGRGKNVRKVSENRRKPSKSGGGSKKNDKSNRKVETGRRDKDRSRESLETGSEEESVERSREEVEESEEEEEVKKVVNKKGNKDSKPVRKPSPPTTTPKPVKTTTKPQETTMKKIPLDNNEFTDIIDKVEGTISAKVVDIEQTQPHKNKDNLQLSPEERKYYTEVSSVMSKYIPPTIESEISGEGESTPNMSARDRQRLSMFVTSKEKRKKKKNVPTYVIRNKRQVEKEKKQYEVSEIVDEPTTAEPSARRLINQYRTSGVVPSQLISELIQRMDLSSREQGTVPNLREPGTGSRRELGGQVSSREQVSVPSLREPVSGTGSRRELGGQLSSREQASAPNLREQVPVTGSRRQGRVRASSPRRKVEKVEVSDDMGEISDPNTQSLRDVISNGGHHRMVLQKGSGRFIGRTEGSRSSDQGKTLLSDGNPLDEVGSSTLERSKTLSDIGGVDSRSSSQGKTAVTNRAVLNEENSHHNHGKIELKSKPVPLSSNEESIEKDDSDSSMDYSLEKGESNPSSVSLLKNGERRRDSYAVSEEDVGDEKPSRNLPFLYQDQIGRANTGDERFSDYDSGLGLAVSVDGEVPRGNLNDRVSNFHKKLVIFTAPNLGTDIGSSENSNQRITSPERGSSSSGGVPRGNLNDRIGNFHRGSSSSTSRENLQSETSGRHHEASRTTNPTRVNPEGSLESTRVRNRPTGSLRQPTNIGETDSESEPRVTPVPGRRRPTSTVNSEEPVETSSESSRSTGVRRRRPTSRSRENLEGSIPQPATISRGRGNLEENIPQTAVGGELRTKQPQRPRSRGNQNLSVGNTEGRSSGRTYQGEDSSRPISGGSRARPSIENSRSALDSSRSTPDSFRPISQGPRSPAENSRPTLDSSRSTPDSFRPIPQGPRSLLAYSKPILDSARSIPDDARTIPESPRLIPDNTWIPDSSRSVVESSRLVPQTSSNLVGSRSIADSSRNQEGSETFPESSRSIADSSRNLEGLKMFPESSRSITDSSRSGEGFRTIPESSRTVPGSLKSVTSRRKPSNIRSEQENVGSFEENGKPTVNTQQSPRGNRQRSRSRQPSLSIPKASTTEATISEGEEEKEKGEEEESYDSQAKKLHSQLFPGENFSCEGKIKGGFYADIESDCRGFFICSQGEINGPLLKSHFWCGEATKFNQRSRTCQADYLVECSISTRYFGLNNDFAVPTEETNTFEPLKVA